MKLSKIVLVGSENITLKINNALPSDPYLLKGADGLSPTEVDVRMSSGIVQGRRPRPRQMVFRMGLNPDYGSDQTISDLRDQIYGLLNNTVDGQITVTLYEGETAHSFTKGVVPKVEVVYFDEEPVVQVTVDCFDSYFKSVSDVRLVNPSRFNFGVNNIGTEITGFEMTILFSQAVTNWRISTGSDHMEFFYSFLSGDFLEFGTDENSQYIYLTRAGVTKNLIDSLSAASDWLNLNIGANAFTFSSNNFTIGEFLYEPKYVGV